MKKEPKINPDLVIHTKLIMIKEHKEKPEKQKRQIRILKEDVHPNKQNQKVYCKNCKHYWFDFSSSIRPGYSPKTLDYCRRNVEEKRNPIGDIITDEGEDCFAVNHNLDCKDFKQKLKWYQRKKRA